MNWYTIFYWVTVADNAITFFGWMAAIFTIFTIIFLIVRLTTDTETVEVKSEKDYSYEKFWYSNTTKTSRKRVYRFAYTFMLFSIFGWAGIVFTPSKKDCLLIIAGGSAATFLSTDSSAKQLPADVAKFLHMSLKKETEDLGSEARQELGIETTKEKFLREAGKLTKEELIERFKNDSTLLK